MKDLSVMKQFAKISLALAMLWILPVVETMSQPAAVGCEVMVFWDEDLGGDFLGTKRNHENLTSFGSWNDQISSIYINSGIWEFFEHAEYRGAVLKLTPGVHNLNSEWNDRISSMRCVQPTEPVR